MAIAVGLLSFFLAFIAWRHVEPDGILFYQGVATSCVSALITGVYAHLARRESRLSATKDSALVFLACYAFMFTVPTTVERSYTVKLLTEIEARQRITEADLLRWIENHWRTDEGLAKRLYEQQASGSITSKDSTITLTRRGRFLVRAFKISAEIFAAEAPEKQ